MVTQGETWEETYLEERRIWRGDVIQWLSEADCDLANYMTHVTVFMSKESASATIILFGTIRPTPSDRSRVNDNNVAVKISFEPVSLLDNSLQVEIAIYRNVISFLLTNRHCPHLTSYLGFTRCVAEEPQLQQVERGKYQTLLAKINRAEYIPEVAWMLFH